MASASLQDELSNYIYNSLLEESVWKTAILEHKRARNYREFLAQQDASREAHAPEKKVLNDKHSSDTNVDCPVCDRDVSATRFAPHLTKCLKLGGRGQAVKKSVTSDLNLPGSESQSSQSPTLKLSKKLAVAGQANPRKRGRPKKNGITSSEPETVLPPGVPRPKKTILTPAESDAILSDAITNATQRLNQKQLGTQTPSTSTNPSGRPSNPAHPLSQSHVANPTSFMAEHGAPPPPKVKLKRKKKPVPHEARSRHSSQASSSSDSDEETVAEDDDDEEQDHDPDGGSDERLGLSQDLEDSRMDTDDPNGKSESRVKGLASSHPRPSSTEISTLPRPAPTSTGSATGTAPTRAQVVVTRPPLKRRSSSQADSTDEDSD